MIAYNKKKIPASLRRAVWNTHIGERWGQSYCLAGCGGIISQLNFVCGHIKAETLGGMTVVDNLLPICTTCNCSMGVENMYDYMKRLGLKKPETQISHNMGCIPCRII